MREINSEELKKIQLCILDEVDAFCREKKINYWVTAGTLLGAIRHKGYIPWDDDIDIGMLRSDYDKFILNFNNVSDKYKVYSYENDNTFYYPHAKVLDTQTVLYEPDKNGNKLSVNIDLFVYDEAKNQQDANKRYFARDLYRTFHLQQNFKYVPKGNIFKCLAVYFVRFISKLFPKGYFMKKIVENSKKQIGKNLPYIANFTAWSRFLCKKEIFTEFIEVEFEGRKYMAPKNYDTWLKCFYTDYMQLPPEEKRVSHHKFEAYVED